MLGRMRRRKEDRPDSGLLYAGSRAPEPARPPEPGDVHRAFEVDRGTLEMRDAAMVLDTPDGTITIPYHRVDAWDDTGKKFRVWWSTGGRDPRNYTASCTPKLPPPAVAGELRDMIRRNTFG